MTVRRTEIIAAGAVVFRPGSRAGEVLLVHRPRYDDWSFPKGKRDRGESTVAAAVREVAEETGVQIRLARPLASQLYPTARGMKRVFYWIGRALEADQAERAVTSYEANEEIDQVIWVPVEKALRKLSYPHDRITLAEALDQPKRTETTVVIRHGHARARSRWKGADTDRPLLATGHSQADSLTPILAAYGVTRVFTSPSRRCVDTMAPYLEAAGLELATEPLLSEEDFDPVATTERVQELARTARRSPLGLCTHRPVLPTVWDALGAGEASITTPELDKGGVIVVHRRKGKVVAIERLSL